MQFLFVYAILLYFCCANVISLTENNLNDLKTTCGNIQAVGDDERTLAPWMVSIFVSNTESSSLDLFSSGTIISSSLILTVIVNKNATITGPVFRKTQFKVDLPDIRNFVVGAGLYDFHANASDEYSQYREVSFVEPYGGVQPEKKFFHLVLLHLKVPLNLSTNYVRSLCLPSVPQSVQEYILARSLFKEYFGALFEGKSYHFSVNQQGIQGSSLQSLNLGNKKDCGEFFKAYYNRHLPVGVYCIKKSPKNGDRTCLKHGQPIAVKILNSRWVSTGLVALIPQNQQVFCDSNTVYFAFVPTFAELKWLMVQLKCKQDQYACRSGSCLQHSQVCDGMRDCRDNEDESPLLCEANKATISAGVKQDRILANTYISTNNRARKFDVSLFFTSPKINLIKYSTTEKWYNSSQPKFSKVIVSAHNSSTVSQQGNLLERSCAGLPKIEGTKIECKHPETLKSIPCSERIPFRTVATLSCEPLYKSKYAYSSIQIMCQSSGKWLVSRPFSCETECGITSTNEEENDENENGFRNLAPWHGAIYRITNGFVYYLCGATLIEKRFLVSAAHCFTNNNKVSSHKAELLKVVLLPASINYTASQLLGSKVYDVKEVFWPLSYESDTLKSDIALIQLHAPVKFTNHIRPACIFPHSKSPIETSSMGVVPGFGMRDKREILFPLKLVHFETVPQSECQKFLGTTDPTTICGAHSGSEELCRGDSGGGLVMTETFHNGIRNVLKGIVSHRVLSKHSCDMNGPVVFTQVSDYRDWILAVMKKG